MAYIALTAIKLTYIDAYDAFSRGNPPIIGGLRQKAPNPPYHTPHHFSATSLT